MGGFRVIKELSRQSLRLLNHLCGFNERRCLRCAEPCLAEKHSSSLGEYSLALCQSCRNLLPRLDSRFCPRCFLPAYLSYSSCTGGLPNNTADHEVGGGEAGRERAGDEALCPACRHTPPPWKNIYCYGVYGGALRELLLKLKFRNNLSAGQLGGLLLCEALIHRYREKFADEPNPWDVIAAVPLHPARLRRRGLNQSLEMAKVLAKALKTPLDPLLLRRVTPTAPQAGLSRRERRRNLRGAIVCSGFAGFKKPPKIQYVHPDSAGPDMSPGFPGSPGSLVSPGFADPEGLTVLLVDDILTTGTTLSRCVESLLNAGAHSVDVAVVARTPL